MSNPLSPNKVLGAAMVVALALCTGAEALAQAKSAGERLAERRARQAEARGETPDQATSDQATSEQPAATGDFAKATRKEPGLKASARLGPKLQSLSKAYDEDDVAKAQELADELLANERANAYEKAVAARIVGSMLASGDDAARGQAYLEQAVALDGLGNAEHYETMLIVSQLQLQDEKYAEALATLDRLLAETQTENPEHHVLRGNALFRLERYPEAIATLKPVIDASPNPRADWTQLLMAAYAESDQPAEAAKLAERVAASTPGDKRAQLNLASVYLQGDQTAKALEVYEGLRARGELTEDRDYRNLLALYLNSEGKEKEAIGAINEGLEKGVLKPDHQTYVALAQAYYFSEQVGPAVEAYQKAAPLAPDGETYLNLAKVLANEGRTAESKQAAQQALDKGLKNPEDARKLLAR